MLTFGYCFQATEKFKKLEESFHELERTLKNETTEKNRLAEINKSLEHEIETLKNRITALEQENSILKARNQSTTQICDCEESQISSCEHSKEELQSNQVTSPNEKQDITSSNNDKEPLNNSNETPKLTRTSTAIYDEQESASPSSQVSSLNRSLKLLKKTMVFENLSSKTPFERSAQNTFVKMCDEAGKIFNEFCTEPSVFLGSKKDDIQNAKAAIQKSNDPEEKGCSSMTLLRKIQEIQLEYLRHDYNEFVLHKNWKVESPQEGSWEAMQTDDNAVPSLKDVICYQELTEKFRQAFSDERKEFCAAIDFLKAFENFEQMFEAPYLESRRQKELKQMNLNCTQPRHTHVHPRKVSSYTVIGRRNSTSLYSIKDLSFPTNTRHSCSEENFIGIGSFGFSSFGYTEEQLQLTEGSTQITDEDISASKLASRSLRTIVPVLPPRKILFCALLQSNEVETRTFLLIGFEEDHQSVLKLYFIEKYHKLTLLISIPFEGTPLCAEQCDRDLVWIGTEGGDICAITISALLKGTSEQIAVAKRFTASSTSIVKLCKYNKRMWVLSQNTIGVWNISKNVCVKTIVLEAPCKTIVFTPFRSIWAGTKIINTRTFKQVSLKSMGSQSPIITSCYVSAANEVWTSHEDKTIIIWDAETRSFKGIFQMAYLTKSICAFGRYVWSTTGSSLICWFAKSHTVIKEIEIITISESSFECLQTLSIVSPNGHIAIAATTLNHGLVIWDTPFYSHDVFDSQEVGKMCVICKKKISGAGVNCVQCKCVQMHKECYNDAIRTSGRINICSNDFSMESNPSEEVGVYLSADHSAKKVTCGKKKDAKRSLTRGGWRKMDAVQLNKVISEFAASPAVSINHLLAFSALPINQLKRHQSVDLAIPTEFQLTSANCEIIAQFLYENRSRLDPSKVGSFLGLKENTAILNSWIKQIDLEPCNVEMSLRRVLRSTNLPGEGQQIERFAKAFGQVYSLIAETDFHATTKPEEKIECFVTLLIFVNTSNHNQNTLSKIALGEFVDMAKEWEVSAGLAEHCFHQINDMEFEFFSALPLPLLQSVFQSGSSTLFVELSKRCITFRKGYGQEIIKRYIISHATIAAPKGKALTIKFTVPQQSSDSRDPAKTDKYVLIARCEYTASLWYQMCTTNGATKEENEADAG